MACFRAARVPLLICASVLLVACASDNVYYDMAEQNSSGQQAQAIETFESQYDSMETAHLSNLQLLCNSFMQLREYARAEKCLDVSLRRLEELKANETAAKKVGKAVMFILGPPSMENDISWEQKVWTVYQQRAYLEMEYGNFPASVDASRKAVFYGSEMGIGRDFTLFLSHAQLGLAHALNGDREEALSYVPKLEAFRFKVFGFVTLAEEHMSKMRRDNVVAIHMALRDWHKAREVMERETAGKAISEILLDSGMKAASAFVDPLSLVADIAIEKKVEYDFSKADWEYSEKVRTHFRIAKIAFETGDHAAARDGYEEILSDPRSANFKDIYYTILHDLGRLKLLEGDRAGAVEDFRRAVDEIEASRANITAEAGKIGFVGDKQAVYQDLVATLVAQGRAAEAFEYAERAKARALVDTLATRKRAPKSAASSATLDVIEQIRSAEETLHSHRATASTREHATTRSASRARVAELMQANPKVASLVTVSAPDVGRIQSLLRRDEALLEYFGASDRMYGFMVTRDRVHAFPVRLETLDDDARQFRDRVQRPSNHGYKAPGRRLYAGLVEPATRNFRGRRLIVVPHGPLHYIPFAALPNRRDSLIDRFEVRVLPSASVMEFLSARVGGSNDATLILGNPDLHDPGMDLPGAEREARQISDLLPGSRLLLREQATETAVRSAAGAFRRLHFASHGIFDPRNPLASGLMLAGDGAQDGFLSVAELYDLDLNADMVTLSACETALGEVASGDDVIGFTRAFLYAGAGSIVSSLWQVDDAATSLLMQKFYENLGTMDRAAALRKAQLHVRKAHQSHPFYWAAFQVTGGV